MIDLGQRPPAIVTSDIGGLTVNEITRKLRAADRLFQSIEGWLVYVMLGAMVFFTFCRIMLRALYTHLHINWANILMGNMEWSDTLVRLFVLWLSFIGASLLTSDSGHIKIDLFSASKKGKWNSFRETAISLSCIVICAVMLKVCIGYILLEMEFGGELFLNIPSWIGQIILPVGFGSILFRFVIMGLNSAIELTKEIRR